MNTQGFQSFIEREKFEIDKLMKVKGEDYSHGDVDRLGNFKEDARDTGLSKYQVWMILWNKHVKSIRKAVRKNPDMPRTASEAIQGRLRDIIVYCLLMLAMLEEDRTSYAGLPIVREKVEPVPNNSTTVVETLNKNHETHVWNELQDDPQGSYTVFWATCTCGFIGSVTQDQALVIKQAREHDPTCVFGLEEVVE